MKHRHTNPLLALFAGLLILATPQLKAQLTVDPTLSAEDLVESLVGGGVTVSGVTVNCANGGFGAFDGSATFLGVDSGLVLTSGQITECIGPNNTANAGVDNFFPGDPTLDTIASGTTNDACILEFDIEVIADTLLFRYVFGSEEYPEFAPPASSGFNDVFAFLISGPGIAGEENIALVPGTTTPVSINNVNVVTNPAYYVDNGDGFTPPFSTDPTYIQYDGYTTVLEARRAVIPCNVYHLKLMIADVADGIYDSGVFIEAGSLTSFGISLSSTTSVGFGFSNAVEGCVDGIITFTRDLVTTDSVTVHYTIAGDATNGVDYAGIADSITILPGDATADLMISPIVDAIAEGIEDVTIYLLSECDGSVIDSVTIGIQDEILLDLNVPTDTTICNGESLSLLATGGIDYTWSPAGSLDDPDIANPVASPTTTTVYTVATEVGTCTDSAMITVNVIPPVPADAGADIAICVGESTDLSASGGISYNWTPSGSLDAPGSANTGANPVFTTVYTVVVTDANGCVGLDSVTVTVNPIPSIIATGDTIVCPGAPAILFAGGSGVSWSWTPIDGLDDPNSQNPTLITETPGTWTVTGTDANGCSNTASIDVNLDDFPSVDAGPDTIVFLGENAILMGSGTGDFFWMPSASLSDPNVPNPTASPSQTTVYYLTTTSEYGCQSIDSMLLTVIFDPIVEFPTAFSPNNDGVNDLFGVIVRGPVDIQAYRIYNRWGEVVFESTDPEGAWDGTHKGQMQDVGTYVFHFAGTDPNGILIERHGTLTLVR